MSGRLAEMPERRVSQMCHKLSEVGTEVRVSVCMATYCGASYIREQVRSILVQLGPLDELVVVDDASHDNTVELLRNFDDPRIRILEISVNQGYVKSFEQAVGASRGEFIFLADQDDIWIPGRLDTMLTALEHNAVVASNFAVLGNSSRGKVPQLRSADSNHFMRNIFGTLIGYRPYYGCGMAMTRSQAKVFVPIPSYLVESHDLWLAMCGNVAKSMVHLDSPTLMRRLHADNVTPRGWRSVSTILRARVMIIRALAEAVRRTRHTNTKVH